MRKLFTLGYPYDDERILLAMKKRGFGEGFYNGAGGKLHNGESFEECLVRELGEELGITPTRMRRRAIIESVFAGDPVIREVHVYHVLDFTGEPKETEEMRPQWFGRHEIPYCSMWPSDRHWFGQFLDGKRLHARFLFKDQYTLLDHAVHAFD